MPQRVRVSSERTSEAVLVSVVSTESMPKPITNLRDKLLASRNTLAGIFLSVLSALLLTIGVVIIKHVNEVSVGDLVLFRYAGLLVFAFSSLLESSEPWYGQLRWNWWVWMSVRAISGASNIFCHYLAIRYISLAETTTICLSTPAVVFVFARIILGEHFGRWHVLALVISTIGVALTSKLHLALFQGHLFSKHTVDLQNRLIGVLFCLGSVFFSAILMIALRKLRGTHHAVILFHFAWIAVIESAIINWLFFGFRLPTNGQAPYYLMVLAVTGFFGQLFLTKALKMEEAGVVSAISCGTEAIFAFIFQVILFAEPVDFYSISGAILVVGSIFLLSFRKYIVSLPTESNLKSKFKFLI